MTVRNMLIDPMHKAELRQKSDPVTALNKTVKRLILDLKVKLQANYVGASYLLPAVEKENRKYTLLSLGVGILVAVVIVISKAERVTP